jgi:hypothetical protein
MIQMKRVLLCAALLAWSSYASAVVYKWVDAQGKTQYGDRPPDGVHAEVVELLGTHPSTRGTAAAPAASDKAAAPAQNTEVKKEVAADVADAHQKQCVEAQDRYKKLIDGRHLYKTGENGERVYLTSEEIDTERLDAKKEIDDLCTQN